MSLILGVGLVGFLDFCLYYKGKSIAKQWPEVLFCGLAFFFSPVSLEYNRSRKNFIYFNVDETFQQGCCVGVGSDSPSL